MMKYSNVVDAILLFSIVAIAIPIGFRFGQMYERRVLIPQSPIVLQEDTTPKVATVVLDGVKNGSLVGSTKGSVRFFVQDDMAAIESDGTFSLPVGNTLVNTIDVYVPEGMQFVASKRGKRYYSVTSASGERIKPENRVYFASEDEAETAGYSK